MPVEASKLLESGAVRDAFTNLRGAIDERWIIEANHDAAEAQHLGHTPCLKDFPGYYEACQRETAAEIALITTILNESREGTS